MGDYLVGHMGTVTPIRGKTEQRVQQVMSTLKDAREPLSYEQIRLRLVHGRAGRPASSTGVLPMTNFSTS